MSTPVPALQDYLFLQPLIIARVQETVPAEEHVVVDGAERMLQALEHDMRPVTLWVLWAGDRIDRSSPAQAALVYQSWLVLLSLRNPSPNQDDRNNVAGPWLARLHNAMAGWQPSGVPGSPKFTRVQGPRPDYKAGSAMYPLQFEIPIHL